MQVPSKTRPVFDCGLDLLPKHFYSSTLQGFDFPMHAYFSRHTSLSHPSVLAQFHRPASQLGAQSVQSADVYTNYKAKSVVVVSQNFANTNLKKFANTSCTRQKKLSTDRGLTCNVVYSARDTCD